MQLSIPETRAGGKSKTQILHVFQSVPVGSRDGRAGVTYFFNQINAIQVL
jgi:hypothetical protein